MTRRWELAEAFDARVASLGLPISQAEAHDLRRAAHQQPLPQAGITEEGDFADLLSLGWAGLYAVSPRFVQVIAPLSGVTPRPLEIVGGPSGYCVLTVTGRCGRVDYAQSTFIRYRGRFRHLRGIVLTDDGGDDDFAIPDNREAILLSRAAGDRLLSAGLRNIDITDADLVEFDIGEDALTR